MVKLGVFLLRVLLDEMVAFSHTIQTAAQAYHVYKDSWIPTIGRVRLLPC